MHFFAMLRAGQAHVMGAVANTEVKDCLTIIQSLLEYLPCAGHLPHVSCVYFDSK